MVAVQGIARLKLAPRAVRCGVPQGAQFIREWGGHTPVQFHWIANAKKRGAVQGIARLSLRPSRAPAIAAGLGASALPCVVLFLATRSALLARSIPSWTP